MLASTRARGTASCGNSTSTLKPRPDILLSIISPYSVNALSTMIISISLVLSLLGTETGSIGCVGGLSWLNGIEGPRSPPRGRGSNALSFKPTPPPPPPLPQNLFPESLKPVGGAREKSLPPLPPVLPPNSPPSEDLPNEESCRDGGKSPLPPR